jgi:hypothetical protein
MKSAIRTAPRNPKGRSQERAVIGPLKHVAAEKIAIIADRLASPKASASQRNMLSK